MRAWGRAVLVVAVLLGGPAMAVEGTPWPPSEGVAAHMRELQATLSSADASPAERAAAKDELSRLLKSPNAPARAPDEKSRPAPARAAIEPFGSVAKQMPNPKIVQPDVATMEVTEPSRTAPPRISLTPQTGRPVVPSTGAAVDPRTGHILHETPFGYVDPRTGAFTPK